ncbi:MAG: prepilin-type N-terminal cleavage/methylation domain-containing protein [Planctomycetes bacterium]|nr:prepilin-type N-terminal cleavage/methylation domain-containing protein [Planctomycetota bacterium]
MASAPSHFSRPTQKESGFTLVELAVVIVIIGVLAAFAVPRFLSAVERSKAGEAYNYLAAVRSAQERFQARQGTYAGALTDLDIQMPAPKYFTIGVIAAGSSGTLESSWTLTLTRAGAAAGYGSYTVTFTDQGFNTDPLKSTIATKPDINPMST